MDTKLAAAQVRLQQWAAIVRERKESGLNQKQWCRMKGMSPNTFPYRCKRVRKAVEQRLLESRSEGTSLIPAEKPSASVDEMEQKPFFAKVNLSPSQHLTSGISIKFSDTLVNIAPDAPAAHIRIVLEVLADAQ